MSLALFAMAVALGVCVHCLFLVLVLSFHHFVRVATCALVSLAPVAIEYPRHDSVDGL